jgi:hypothetical protein
MIVHGGLFHCADATLEELNEINRFNFSLQDIPEGQSHDTNPLHSLS